MKALRFTATFFDHRLPVAGEVSLFAGLAFRNKRRPHQAVFQQLYAPLCVANIGLVRQIKKAWKLRNTDATRAGLQRRRASARTGSLSKNIIPSLMKLQRGKCATH